ncbi:MAG: metallophosphoesterase [Patescibacteria group bacterium]
MDCSKAQKIGRIYDYLTAALALIALAIIYIDWRADGQMSAIGYLFVIGLVLIIYGVFFEPRRLSIRHYKEKLVKDPKSWIRIVFLSDFHAGGFRPKGWYERVAAEAQSLDPDVFILGGDYVEESASAIQEIKAISKVTAHLGKYFVLGNHDFLDRPQFIRETLSNWGLVDLTNAHVTIRKGERDVQLSALDDHWHGRPLIPPLRVSDEIPHITVAHEPDAILDFKTGDTDLILAGHTHGGQIRLPLIGSLAPIPAKLGRKVSRRRKFINGTPMIISQGCGETDFGARLFCPAQIVVVEIGI